MRNASDLPTAAEPRSREGMLTIPGGRFQMGSDTRRHPHDAPRHDVEVAPFLIDVFPVTNRQFAQFVDETSYVTRAEHALAPGDYPGIPANRLRPGALQFRASRNSLRRDHWELWWVTVPGAHWRQPEGTSSVFGDRLDHPVTCIAYQDAKAYARWAGKSLPTEAQWEFAARGGLADAEYAWGDEFMPHGRRMANTWHGDRFPYDDEPLRTYRTTAVGSFPSNGYGLYDMIGNVWEWTSDVHYQSVNGHDQTTGNGNGHAREHGNGNGQSNGHAPADAAPLGPPWMWLPARVVKGGSFLCAPNYCSGFRPAARQGSSVDTASAHIGFRCVTSPRSWEP